MPKTGFQYAQSREKRAVDLAFATAARPVYVGARMAVRHLLPADVSPVFEQKRIGQGHEPFTIRKLQTFDAGNIEVAGNWARLIRKFGVDELAQVQNVWQGDMSVVGYRPLIPSEFEEVLDNLPPGLKNKWYDITWHTKPGIVSSYGIDHHVRPEPDANEYERRAEQDVRDAREASLSYDARLIGELARLGLQRRLQ